MIYLMMKARTTMADLIDREELLNKFPVWLDKTIDRELVVDIISEKIILN